MLKVLPIIQHLRKRFASIFLDISLEGILGNFVLLHKRQASKAFNHSSNDGTTSFTCPASPTCCLFPLWLSMPWSK